MKTGNARDGGEDLESKVSLTSLENLEVLQKNRIHGVRTVLVILSSAGMVFDIESLRQKVLLIYPDATIFFRTTSGKALGAPSFKSVDLLVDLTGPGQRQPWFYSKKLRRMSRFAVGRNAGFFRKKSYDRVFDEKERTATLPTEDLNRERFVQRQVLALAGVPMAPVGDLGQDRGKDIALDLPPLSHQ